MNISLKKDEKVISHHIDFFFWINRILNIISGSEYNLKDMDTRLMIKLDND